MSNLHFRRNISCVQFLLEGGSVNIKKYVRLFALTFGLTATVVFAVSFPVSCRLSDEGIEILKDDLTSPKIVSFSVQDKSNLVLACSKQIIVSGTKVKSSEGTCIEEDLKTTYSTDGTKVNFNLKNPTEIGKSYELSGTIKDQGGNTLTFSLPFEGFNENPARLLLSEVRSKHLASSGEIKRAEFVELYVLKAGNLAGLALESGSDGAEKKYEFPCIQVKQGEYIIVHFRTVTGGDCIDEMGDDLSLSTASDSHNSARDLWIKNTESRISDSDIIVLRNSCKSSIEDAVLFSGSGKNSWHYESSKKLAKDASESGIWTFGEEIENAACSDGVTVARTLCRNNIKDLNSKFSKGELNDKSLITATKDDWFVAKSCTPGEENSSVAYTK